MNSNNPPSLAQVTRELLQTHHRFPRKRLGQHFLIDPQVLQRIVDALEVKPHDLVIEVGSGLGVLTLELAKQAGKVLAIEIDKELLEISQKILQKFTNLDFIAQDILKTDLTPFIRGVNYRVAGNLPYYITAPILEKFLTADSKAQQMVFMVQKEVAERMAAAPGSKKYGSFSIFVQYHATVQLHSLVSKSSFLPWPEVSSAIVVLKPYQIPRYPVKNEKLFFDIVHAAFQQRRKKLRNSLAAFINAPVGAELFSPYNFQTLQDKRPEELSIDEFVGIANILSRSL